MKVIKENEMIAATWGYEQTNVTFFKVLKRTNNSVTLQEWEQEFVSEAGYLAEVVKAGTKPAKEQDHYIDENGDFQTRIIDAKPIRRKLHVTKERWNGDSEFVKVKSYMWAYPIASDAEILQTHYH